MEGVLIYRFPIIYEILIRSYDYWYTDTAISLLNQLNRRTQQMCFSNFHILLSDKFMKKRVVTVKSKDQKHLKDPRLAYFKVKFQMNTDFGLNQLKKFVKFFDDLKDDTYWLSFSFNKLGLTEEWVESKLPAKLNLVNVDELKKAKHLNIHFIKQDINNIILITNFWEILRLHEPDLIHSAFDKIQIVKMNSMYWKNRKVAYRNEIARELCIFRLTKSLK